MRLYTCVEGHLIMSMGADWCACGAPLAEIKQETLMDRARELVGHMAAAGIPGDTDE